MEIWKEGKMEKLTVRPRLHCPEIDEVDEISMENIVGTFEGNNELKIGDKIVYMI